MPGESGDTLRRSLGAQTNDSRVVSRETGAVKSILADPGLWSWLQEALWSIFEGRIDGHGPNSRTCRVENPYCKKNVAARTTCLPPAVRAIGSGYLPTPA